MYIDFWNIYHLHGNKKLLTFQIIMSSEMENVSKWMDLDDCFGLCGNCLMLTLEIVNEKGRLCWIFDRLPI
jgi:hypothetical protein